MRATEPISIGDRRLKRGICRSNSNDQRNNLSIFGKVTNNSLIAPNGYRFFFQYGRCGASVAGRVTTSTAV